MSSNFFIINYFGSSKIIGQDPSQIIIIINYN